MLDDLAPIKDDEEAVKSYGLAFGVEMCRRLLELGAPGTPLTLPSLPLPPINMLPPSPPHPPIRPR